MTDDAYRSQSEAGMSDAEPDMTDDGKLTIEQVLKMVEGLSEKGVINLDAPLKDLTSPLKDTLAGEADLTIQGEIYVWDHWWAIGPSPH
ncbi:hypothetical protein AB0F11_13515 [Streptomyces sp. NPDC032472]|uniref:hypothetical protein n=1 Tax=Streptomyces sp. NPDC032472 TaxID=3155018 RepID=UPI0034012F8C